MTRAVVKLSQGIGYELERISKLIEGCRYNPELNIAAFCEGRIVVSLKSDEISILGIRDESDAHHITGKIKNLLEVNEN